MKGRRLLLVFRYRLLKKTVLARVYNYTISSGRFIYVFIFRYKRNFVNFFFIYFCVRSSIGNARMLEETFFRKERSTKCHAADVRYFIRTVLFYGESVFRKY